MYNIVHVYSMNLLNISEEMKKKYQWLFQEIPTSGEGGEGRNLVLSLQHYESFLV